MANFEIKINDNIEVLYNKEIYKSKIQDVEDDSISIYLPGSEGKYIVSACRYSSKYGTP